MPNRKYPVELQIDESTIYRKWTTLVYTDDKRRL